MSSSTIVYEAEQGGHVGFVREGRGWKEAYQTGLPVESNYVMECSCGRTMSIASRDVKFARETLDGHLRWVQHYET